MPNKHILTYNISICYFLKSVNNKTKDKNFEDLINNLKDANCKNDFIQQIIKEEINYLGNTKDDFIDYFIISSPVDIMHWWNIMPNIDKCFELAKKWTKEGRGDDILPFMFGGFSPMTAKTVIGFYNADNLKNCPVISKMGETKSLYNIKPFGTFLIGSKDSVTGNSPKGFMQTLNSWTKHPEKNLVIEIEGASHIFYNMHNEYANTILNCINEHFMSKV